MTYPVDGTSLVTSDSSAGEIGYCPQRRGVWLESGKLDKFTDRSAPAALLQSPLRGEYRAGCKKKKHGGFVDQLFES